jgi:ribonucleoside-diphosphate reductase alpha chain
MVVLNADHPDIEEFVWTKAREERKIRVLSDAGFDMGVDGSDMSSVQYQNANNSVRVTDEFMEAAVNDDDWDLTAVSNGETIETVSAQSLLHDIADAAWQCADPGVQFDTTINRWNTAANTGRINASNPCSEYVHLDDSACNLASLNLLTFLAEGTNVFDSEAFAASVEIVFIAQEILVGNADYPTESIGETARSFRQLGIGYANLGAPLMASGLPYDSEQGRTMAAAITALMTGQAYLTSAKMAGRMGPFAGFHENREPTLEVLSMHREAVSGIDETLVDHGLLGAAQQAWDQTCEMAAVNGVRNSQASVLAPTGTIGLLMDCDTTGIEPDLSLVKTKKLVGGGTMSIVNQTIPRALVTLGYSEGEVIEIVDFIHENSTAIGAPSLRAEHLPVFACSMGDNPIHHLGHVKMMAAAQPFLSGAISKTVNMPEDVTVEDVEQLYVEAWRMGLKAVAIYRDNCKVGQPLSSGKRVAGDTDDSADDATNTALAALLSSVPEPIRRKLPRSRRSRTLEFRVADCKGFVTVGEYDDGRPGEMFCRVSKQGSTMAGIMDAFAISVSHGLQYGVPMRAFVEAFVGMRFEPAGMTDDPELRIASSIIDYMFRRLAVEYLSAEERAELNILTVGERTQQTLPGVVESVTETRQGSDIAPDPPSIPSASQLEAQMAFESRPTTQDSPLCMQCGIHMQRAGSCYVCADCGTTSGCS